MSDNSIPTHGSVRRSISFDGPTPPITTNTNNTTTVDDDVALSPTRALELPTTAISESVSTAVCGSLEVDMGQTLTPQQQQANHTNNSIHSVSPGVRTPGRATTSNEAEPPKTTTTSSDNFNDDDEPQITCTVVTIETSMQRPVEAFGDPVLSPTTRTLVKQVPVLHIFGYTQDYSTCCVHIHGALPYFLVPCYTTNMSPEDFAGQLETAARRGGGTGGAPLVRPGTPVIHLVEVVMGLPFYGYHGTKRPFFKVFIYQPTLVSKLAMLLGSTSEVGGRRWQPYEAHIPFAFQCMADMNLSGMGVLPMAGGTFRSNSALPDGLYIHQSNDTAHHQNRDANDKNDIDDDGVTPPMPPPPPKEAYTRLSIPSRVFDPISGTMMTLPRLMAHFTRSTDDSRPREALSAVELDTTVDHILKGRERRMGGPPVPGENLSVVRKSLSKILCDTLHHTKAGAADVLKDAILDRFAEDRRVVGGSVEMAQQAAPLVPHMHDLATSYCNNRMSMSQGGGGLLSQGSPLGGRSLDLPVAMTPSAETSSILQEWFCDASNASLTNLLHRKEQRAAEQQRQQQLLASGSSDSRLLQGGDNNHQSPLSQIMFPRMSSSPNNNGGEDNGGDDEGAFDFTVCPTFELLDFMRDGDAAEDSEPKLTPLVNDDSDGEGEEEEEGGGGNGHNDADVDDTSDSEEDTPHTTITDNTTTTSSSPPRAPPRKIQFDDDNDNAVVAVTSLVARSTHIMGEKRSRDDTNNNSGDAAVDDDDEETVLFPSSRARREVTTTTTTTTATHSSEPSNTTTALLASLDGYEGTIGGRRLRIRVGNMMDGGDMTTLFHEDVPTPSIHSTGTTTTTAVVAEEGEDDTSSSDADSDDGGMMMMPHRPSSSGIVDDDIGGVLVVEEGALCTQYGAATQRWLAAEDDGGGAVTMSMLLGESSRTLNGGGGGGAVSSSAPILTAITPRSKKVRRPKFRMSPSQPLNTQQRSCISMLKVLSIDIIAMPPACGKVVHAATSPLLAVGLAYTLSTTDTIEYKQFCIWPDYTPETSPYHHTTSSSSSSSNNTRVFKTERQLFTALVKEVRAADPDVVMSWDVDKYGLGYLVERGRLSSRIDLLDAMGRMRPDGLAGDNDGEGYSSLGGGSGSGGEFKRVSWGVGSMRRDAARSEPPPLQRREGVVTIKIPGRIVIPLRKCAKSELKQKSYTFQAVYQTLFNRPCPYVQDDVLAAMYASGVSGATLDTLNTRVLPSHVKGEMGGGLKDEIKDDPDGDDDMPSKTNPTTTASTTTNPTTNTTTSYFMKVRTPLALHCLQVQVVGTLRVAKAMDLYVRTSEMAQLYGILFFEVLSRGSQFKVESFLQRFAKPRNFVLVSPSRQQVMLANQQEGIPLVMEPYSALYTDPVVVLDFRSLYPSVVIAYNLCYSTCLGKVNKNSRVQIGSLRNYRINDDFLSNALANDGITFAPNSCMYAKKSHRDGVLPAMLESILQTRFQVQKVIKGANERGEEDLARVLDAQQLALKMLANVTYGYTAATFSGRMPCTDLADSIVLLGRQTLERAMRTIQGNTAWNAKIVYGDTDSLFIQLPGRTRMQAFDVAEEMVRAVNAANPDPVTLKFEKVYHPCFMVVKKRYVGYAYEHRSQTVPKFDAKGIETVRRDQCEATSKVCEELIRALFDSVVKGGKHVVSPPPSSSSHHVNTLASSSLRLPVAQPVSTSTTPVMLDVDNDSNIVANVDEDDDIDEHEGSLAASVGGGEKVPPSLSWKAVTVKLKRYFYEQANKIQRGDAHPSDYIIRREVKLGTYAKESSLPPAARVAVQRIEADAGDCPAYGDRVPYVVLCPTTGDQLKDMVADPFTLLRRNLHAALQSHLHNKHRQNSDNLMIKMASGEDAPQDNIDDGPSSIKAEGDGDDGDFLTRVGVRCLQPLSPDGGISVLTALYPNNNNTSSSSSSSTPPAYFLLNGDHYLRKHIIPSLNRLFHMVGIDFMRWYETMPKAASNNEGSLLFHKFFETATGGGSNGGVSIKKDPTPSSSSSLSMNPSPTTTSSTLDQYYSSTRCVVCHGDGSTHSRTLQREQKQRQQAAKVAKVTSATSSSAAGVVDVDDDSSSSDVEGCASLVAQPKPTHNTTATTTTTSGNNDENPFAAGVRLNRRMGVHPLVRKPSVEIAEVEDFTQLPAASSSLEAHPKPKPATKSSSSSSSLSPLVPICASCLSPERRGAALFNITTRRHYLDRYYHRLLARCHSCMGCNQGDVVLSRAERAENIMAAHAEEDAESASVRRQYQAAKNLSTPLPFPYNSSSSSSSAPSLPNGDPVCVGDANIADLEDLCLSIDCPTTFEKQRIRALRQHIGIIEGFLESDPMVEEALRRREADGRVTMDSATTVTTIGSGRGLGVVRGQDANSVFHRSAPPTLSSSSSATPRGTPFPHHTTTAAATHSSLRGGGTSRGRGGTRGGGGGRGAHVPSSSSSRRPPQAGKRKADDDDVVILD